jgi:hypothetical protein
MMTINLKSESPYRGALSEAILQLQESGEISRMKTKWWKEKRGGGKCSVSDSSFTRILHKLENS